MDTNTQQAHFIDTNEWVPIHTLPGFESAIEYYVNKEGQVKSTKGSIERILKNYISANGYPMISLTQRIGRKKTLKVCVHKLVAFAFLGNPPTPYGRGPGCTMIDHKDEDKTNCHADNLRWVTRSENNNKGPYRRFGGQVIPGEPYAERKNECNREYMRRKRQDPEYKEAEAQRQRERRADESYKDKELERARGYDAKRRATASEEHKKKNREYQREWARKNRAKKKQENTLQ